MDISIIIVNYKSSQYLRSCIESIFASELNVEYEIIIVDNNSLDEGLIDIKNKYPTVKFIYLLENKGFARGNNVGIKNAQGRVVLLLNPDTIVEKNTIQDLFDKLMENEKIGIVGPKIYYGDGSLQTKFLAKKIPKIYYFFLEIFYLDKLFSFSELMNSYYGTNFDFNKEQYLDQVCGACLMIKREVINRIGPMDEHFFLYFEETDWCFRAIQSGYKVVYVPFASIIHHEGKSSSIMMKKSVEAYYKSELFFFRKHYGVFKTVLLYFTNLFGFTFRLLAIPIYLIKDKNFYKISRQCWALLFHLNGKNLFKALKNE